MAGPADRCSRGYLQAWAARGPLDLVTAAGDQVPVGDPAALRAAVHADFRGREWAVGARVRSLPGPTAAPKLPHRCCHQRLSMGGPAHRYSKLSVGSGGTKAER